MKWIMGCGLSLTLLLSACASSGTPVETKKSAVSDQYYATVPTDGLVPKGYQTRVAVPFCPGSSEMSDARVWGQIKNAKGWRKCHCPGSFTDTMADDKHDKTLKTESYPTHVQLYFDYGSTELTEVEQEKLQHLKQSSQSRITIVGHASQRVNPGVGPEKRKIVNQKVSEQRAEKVRDLLVEQGADSHQVNESAKGDTVSNPMSPAGLTQEEADRRVDIFFDKP